MTSATDPPEPGTCTVIVARHDPRDPERDRALIRGVQDVLDLPEGTADLAGLARPEFRIVEGVSRATADRVVAVAIRAGFSPRVREELGIKWSNQRGSIGILFVALFAALAPALVLALLTSAPAAGLFLGGVAAALGSLGLTLLLVPIYLALVFGLLAWQRSRTWLPLIVSPEQVFGAPDETPTMEEEIGPVAEARSAVEALRNALDPAMSAVVRADLVASVEALDARVTALARVERALAHGSSSGLVALRRRQDALRSRPDADPVELESLAQAIRAETEADDARERRLAEGVRDLLAIRRAATRARLSLADPDTTDPVARLNREIDALEGVRAETDPAGPHGADPHRAAALRARRSQREG